MKTLDLETASPPWYALQVRARTEPNVSLLLRQKGFCTYVPALTVSKKYSDRVRSVELPLFPSYLFCRLDLERRWDVLNTLNVLKVVGLGRTPVPVPEAQVEAVRRVATVGGAEPCPYLEVGQRVAVERGPLAGLEGILLEKRNGLHLVVSVNLLQRAVSVHVDAACLRPLCRTGDLVA